MKAGKVTFLCALILTTVLATLGFQKERPPAGEAFLTAADGFLGTLDDEEKKLAVMDYDSPERVAWHFIPKDARKGLVVKDMNPKQRKAASQLLRAGLSFLGYKKFTDIMKLEGVLHELEKASPGRFPRDTQLYYYTLFGKPAKEGKWGVSIEGHHMSLNFVIEDNEVISSTPQVMCSNPTIVPADLAGFEKGARVLDNEETLAFDLVHSLSDEQKKTAIIAETAPKEVRNAGAAQPPQTAAEGIAMRVLEDEQKKLLRQLIFSYTRSMASDIAAKRIAEIKEAGWGKIKFCWAGASKPGIGHYYRVQGPTFIIEFVNTQPDAAGNPASHIHCLWRDTRGDFAITVKK
ncbi:MAG: hypothetical protein CMJ76_01715 [Planctomycetaceae bacterium]|nr:hypothetical protein [Planctomycetaceae bacterium]